MSWVHSFFDQEYNRMYNPLLTDELSKREADFIEKVLELNKEHEILDLPCGFGRHAIELTRRGYRVTGIDYHPEQIHEAKKNMDRQGISFPIQKGDMRDLSLEKKYHRLYNFFSSFGYFSEEENKKVVEEFYRILLPGGMVLLEMLGRDAVVRNFLPAQIDRRGETLFIAERFFDPLTSRVQDNRIIIEPDGKRVEKKSDLRVYSPHELISLFTEAGFEIVNVYGDGEKKYHRLSSRIALVAKKTS